MDATISERLQQKIDRTLEQHIEALSKTTELRGSAQSILDVLAEAITDLNAAVVVLLQREQEKIMQRREQEGR